ncbi:sigma-70 family RNA polymerase sigma factor [Streptomyces sp. NPDC127119]|uniref:sigma-70 family RNA polymerase sigma factor n=1 Tax=Streptomyces sp. NPDC127119 TaxID=3345370 RepID=UPI0036433853
MADRDGPRPRHADALAELVAERYDRMVRYAARRLYARDVPRSSADPEDIVQNALLAVLAHDEPIGNLRAYLYTCMTNEATRAARHHYAGRGYESLDADVRPEDEPTICPVADAERRHAIDEAMAGLPRQQHKAFWLTWELGMTHEQAARVMGTATNTAGVHAHRAVKALRVALFGLGTALVAWTTWAVASGTRQVLPGSGPETDPVRYAVTAGLALALGLTGAGLGAAPYLRRLVWGATVAALAFRMVLTLRQPHFRAAQRGDPRPRLGSVFK